MDVSRNYERRPNPLHGAPERFAPLFAIRESLGRAVRDEDVYVRLDIFEVRVGSLTGPVEVRTIEDNRASARRGRACGGPLLKDDGQLETRVPQQGGVREELRSSPVPVCVVLVIAHRDELRFVREGAEPVVEVSNVVLLPKQRKIARVPLEFHPAFGESRACH